MNGHDEYLAAEIPPPDMGPDGAEQRRDLFPWRPGTVREEVLDHPDLILFAALVPPFDPNRMPVGNPAVGK